MEQHEAVEYDLEQQAVALKRQGKSVRQIAEALNISPSRAYRLLKNTEEQPEAETATECTATSTAAERDSTTEALSS